MRTELAFFIEDKSLEELVKEKKMYPGLRRAVRTRSENKKTENDNIEMLVIAELNTNIAILYQLYKANTLCAEFENNVIRKDGNAYFGDERSRVQAHSKICRVLADLDVPKIGASPKLADLYHELRLEVDDSKKTSKSFLHSERFWCLYFMFYREYNSDS